MRSRDAGTTWEKSDGTRIELPAGPEEMDIIARTIGKRHEPMPPPEMISSSLSVTNDSRVRIMCLSHYDKPGETLLYEISPTGAWESASINLVETVYPDMRPVACAFALRRDDSVCALVTLAPLSHGWLDGKPLRDRDIEEKADRRAVWLVSDPADERFRLVPEIEPGVRFNLPTFERPTGVNTIPGGTLPSYLYFDGSSAYPGGLRSYFDDVPGYVKHGELIANNVFWVAPRSV